MRAGLAAMQLLDEPAFARLDAIGEAVRTGIDQAFRRSGIPGGTVGLGSLLKIHFADRPIRDYRSAYLTEQEAQRQVVFNSRASQSGVLAAGYGLMALSTPMTDADVGRDRRGGGGRAGGSSCLGLITVTSSTRTFSSRNVCPPRSIHHAIRRSASSELDREGNGRSHASHLLLADPQFQPRFLARHLRHQRTPDRAGADHIPVHVGALPWATLAVEARFKDVRPGDVILLNDPYHGGSHLPDLTAFVPIFDGERRLLWTIVSRAPERYGGANAWRLQSWRDRDLAGGTACSPDQALRGGTAAR